MFASLRLEGDQFTVKERHRKSLRDIQPIKNNGQGALIGLVVVEVGTQSNDPAGFQEAMNLMRILLLTMASDIWWIVMEPLQRHEGFGRYIIIGRSSLMA